MNTPVPFHAENVDKCLGPDYKPTKPIDAMALIYAETVTTLGRDLDYQIFPHRQKVDALAECLLRFFVMNHCNGVEYLNIDFDQALEGVAQDIHLRVFEVACGMGPRFYTSSESVNRQLI